MGFYTTNLMHPDIFTQYRKRQLKLDVKYEDSDAKRPLHHPVITCT